VQPRAVMKKVNKLVLPGRSKKKPPDSGSFGEGGKK
jgi:hypothetical protein